MKKFFPILIIIEVFISFFPISIFAQEKPRTGPDGYVRCGTSGYVTWLKANDTSFGTRFAAAERQIKIEENKQIAEHRSGLTGVAGYTLPVVVHVLWGNDTEKIPVWQVQSQIAVLNRDYNRRNADTVNTPPVFRNAASGMNISFCLAQRDPNGNPTDGVVYKQVPPSTQFIDNDAMKYPSKGGDTAWDVTKYLNIWVCNLAGGLLGYSVFPFMPLNARFGSVVLYSAFGDTVAPPCMLLANYNLGRTATHEIGHLLDLHHPWADDYGLCPWNSGGASDSIPDIPPEGNDKSDGYGSGWGPTFGCPPFPYTDNCTTSFPGIMFENYMEYTNDACMNLFSHDQELRAQAALNGPLAPLLTSNGCTPLSVDDLTLSQQISVFPNPADGKLNVELAANGVEWSAEVFNVLSQPVYSQYRIKAKLAVIDLSGQPAGIYILRIANGASVSCKKIILTR